MTATGGGTRLDLSRAALNDLLNNTLDGGYGSAAARERPARWFDGPLVWLACLAVGLLLVVAYQQSHLAAPARDAARKELINRIGSAQSTANQLESQDKQLSSEVASLRDAQLAGTDQALRNAELAAGSSAATGPGMQLEIGEPTSQASAGNARPGTTLTSAVIRDTDIRAVVNELWTDGAEAIAVNGLRLTPTSFIRLAGESIQIDFTPLTSPYTISAIGNSNELQVGFAQSQIARRLKTLAAVEGISFRFGGKSKLRLPSVTVGDLRYAEPGASAPPSAVPSSAASSPSASPTASESR